MTPCTYGNAGVRCAEPGDPRVEVLAQAMYEEDNEEAHTGHTWEQMKATGGESGGIAGLYCAKAAVILPRLDDVA